MPKLSVVLPAFNEEENIETCVEGVRRFVKRRFSEFEILVVDDGSQDKTAEIVRKIAAEDKRVKLISHRNNRGHGAALRSGFYRAKGDLIFYTDADNQFDVSDLKKLLPLIGDYDIVAGYRVGRQDPLMRVFISWANNLIMRLVYGLKLKDIDCSFKLFRRKVFEQIKLKSETGFIDAELFVRAQKAGLTVTQVGVKHLPRREGKTAYEIGFRNRIFAFVKPGVILAIFKEMLTLDKDLRKK